MERLDDALHTFYTIRACGASALTLMAYDICLTASREIKYFWAEEWSIATGLYFLNRYWGFLTQIFQVFVFFNPRSPKVSIGWIWFQDWIVVIQLWAIESILIYRIHTLYHNRKILFVISTCLFFQAAAQICIMSVSTSTTPGTMFPLNPITDFRFCSSSVQTLGIWWTFWIPTLLFEVLLFCLSLYKCVEKVKTETSRKGSSFDMEDDPSLKTQCLCERFLISLFRESFWCYLSVLVISIVAILLFLSVNAGQGYAGGIDSALFSIIGTRLLLHLREDTCRFFEPTEPTDDSDDPMEFASTDYEYGAFPITGIPAGQIGGMDFLKRVHPPRPRLKVRRTSGDVSTISERTERSEETVMEEGGDCGIRLTVMRSSSIGESITTLESPVFVPGSPPRLESKDGSRGSSREEIN
ncbi:hypothetical protein SISNIDRAFT_456529 [Sistotremastrum niveocremeum HHB9708]|uniref:DUF6533 domain-containing protein n=1 Tax=Sistotremastrum niveocremeum HHB9708 TaxID=1314777 RepID=A0A164SLZ6_9AGAM|nr:hypothetical protein SISNIDRAFT_456529 [Sistotremastrum niveocremeum HHB9708]